MSKCICLHFVLHLNTQQALICFPVYFSIRIHFQFRLNSPNLSLSSKIRQHLSKSAERSRSIIQAQIAEFPPQTRDIRYSRIFMHQHVWPRFELNVITTKSYFWKRLSQKCNDFNYGSLCSL